MATIYSTRFCDVTISAGTTPLYTVPTGFVAVIREVLLLIADSGARAQLIRSGGGANIILHTAAAANEYTQWDMRAVLNAGDVLDGAIVTGTAGFFISGYLLEGP